MATNDPLRPGYYWFDDNGTLKVVRVGDGPSQTAQECGYSWEIDVPTNRHKFIEGPLEPPTRSLASR